MQDTPSSPTRRPLPIFNPLVPPYAPEVKRLGRVATSHLEIQGLNDVAALASCIKHGPKKNLGLSIFMQKANEHWLRHPKIAAPYESEIEHRGG